MNLETARDEFFTKMGDQIGRDGIYADHDQRKRPFAIAFHVDDPTEGGEQKEARTAAEECPTRGPDALHNGTNTGKVQQESRRNSDDACDGEALQRNERERMPGTTGPQPDPESLCRVSG